MCEDSCHNCLTKKYLTKHFFSKHRKPLLQGVKSNSIFYLTLYKFLRMTKKIQIYFLFLASVCWHSEYIFENGKMGMFGLSSFALVEHFCNGAKQVQVSPLFR